MISFQMDLHLSGLPRFRQDPIRGSTLAQGEVSSDPVHPGDPGRVGQRRISADHREQKVSEGTKPRVRVSRQGPSSAEERGRDPPQPKVHKS